MAFNSFSFWLIFPLVFGIYWLIPARHNPMRKLFLVIVSYLFYLNWKPAFALVLLYVTAVTFLGGQMIGQRGKASGKKALAWSFAFLGLLPLLLFKYWNFINGSVSDALAFLGLGFRLSGLNWAIPVGISFYSFQAVGYLLDVYHGRTASEKSFLDYLLFVSFFPQVLSGPISKADELMPQIRNPHVFDYRQGKQGLKFLLWGLFIKLAVADRCGIFVNTVYQNLTNYNGSTCFVASILYSIQVYCDFAGYSLMAVGIAKTLGFNLVENFRRPYLALSMTEFWRRWHISLTRWFTWQIYVPLGGNRCPLVRCCFNVIITFLVSGLWHGAAWTFVLWGAVHGILLSVEKLLHLEKCESRNIFVKIVRLFAVFLLVDFAWVFFRMPSVSEALSLFGRMFTDFGKPGLMSMGTSSFCILVTCLTILVFKECREEFFKNRMRFLEARWVRWAIYVLLFCLTLSFGVLDGGQFIYASF